ASKRNQKVATKRHKIHKIILRLCAFCGYLLPPLKHIFECELHDPGTARRWSRSCRATRCARACCAAKDPAERIRITESHAGVPRTETVRYVKRFSSNFDAVVFLYLELP